jgi:hypothetical protein
MQSYYLSMNPVSCESRKFLKIVEGPYMDPL